MKQMWIGKGIICLAAVMMLVMMPLCACCAETEDMEDIQPANVNVKLVSYDIVDRYIENRIGAGICNIRRRMTYPTDNIWMTWGTDDSGGDFQVYWGKGIITDSQLQSIAVLMNSVR